MRGTTAVLIWLGTILVLCAQLDGAATVLQQLGGISHATGCLIAAAVLTAYFAGGGLASAARVNSVQLVVKLAGFLLAAPIALAAAGGWTAAFAGSGLPSHVLDAGSREAGWPLLFILGPAFFLSPGLLQKAYAAGNERALRAGIAANGIALMVFGFLPLMLGVAARVLHPSLADGQLALATVLSTDMPFSVGALALAAVFSAELSAADAVLFMLSTSGARDIYKRFINVEATDAQVLRAARVAALAGGALGYAMTFIYPSVIDALKMFYSLLVVSLFAPILGGLFFPAAGRRAALASLATGVAALAAAQLATGGRGYGWVSPTMAAMAASGLVYGAFIPGAARTHTNR